MINTPFKLSSRLFIMWLLLLILFYFAGNLIFGLDKNVTIYNLANWDGRHFLEIAEKGYTSKTEYAFFPLYPLSVNFVAKLFNISFLYAGILTSTISAFGSIYIFLKILQLYGKGSNLVIVYFLIFPTSFFLITAYSESLFLLLTLMTFFLAERKSFFLAALFASLSSMTRIVGISVILGLALYVYKSRASIRKKIFILSVSLSGFTLYCLYLYVQTGNPFYFLVSELSWGRAIFIPGINILDSVTYITVLGIKPESFTIFSDLVFTMFGIGMGLRTIRFLKLPLVIYTLFSLLIPLTTALLLSFPRFLLVIFPIFIVLSKTNNRIFKISYVIFSMVLLFLYFNFFLRSIWVS